MESLRLFDLGFLQALKLIQRKLKYREIGFRKFPGLPCFSKKMALYLFTKFGIISL